MMASTTSATLHHARSGGLRPGQTGPGQTGPGQTKQLGTKIITKDNSNKRPGINGYGDLSICSFLLEKKRAFLFINLRSASPCAE